MNQTTVAAVGDVQRTRLAQIADLLIPEAHGMPAAGGVGVAGRQLDRILGARPDLAEPLRRALDTLTATDLASLEAELDRLEADDAPAKEALLQTVVGGYYTHPEVRRLLRYDGQEPQEVHAEIIPNYVEEGLIDPVLERGPIYRPVPREEEPS